MSDYINREDAIKAVKHLSRNYTGRGKREDHPHIDFIIDEIKYEVPSADVAPVRHGRWIEGPMCIECSCCGELFNDEIMYMHDPFGKPRYCPCCGSRMDVGEEDE